MQSPAAVTGRALIILACIVGIPMAALSGASWSDVLAKLDKLQDFPKNYWPALFQQASPPTVAVAPSPLNAPLPFSPLEATEMRSNPLRQTTTAAAVVPVGFQSPAAPTPSGVRPHDQDQSVPGASPLDADPFASIQDRLRQLGATYYLLESWGNDRQMYRFYCKIAVRGNAAFTHCFEATDADPLQAMVEVLHQVEDEGGRGKGEGGDGSG